MNGQKMNSNSVTGIKSFSMKPWVMNHIDEVTFMREKIQPRKGSISHEMSILTGPSVSGRKDEPA
jgi:hypothetical protein